MRIPSIQQSLESLIASPSVSSVNSQWDQGNRGVIELLDQWFSDLGFRSEILPVDGYPGKYNLVASAGSGPEGLVLSGHTDTVPFDESNWHQSPFKLTERDNRFYGLGTCDMKGFFALVLDAVRDLDLARLRQPLTIIATADEESTMCGALAIRDLSRHLGRHVVIGEPTNLRPIRMHKGMYSQRLRIVGHSGHSSNPALGNNAMEGMHKAMTELLGDPPARLAVVLRLERRHAQRQRRVPLARVAQVVVALEVGALGQDDVGIPGDFRGHRVDDDVLGVGVGATPDRAETVEGRHADRGGEVAVAASPDGDPLDAGRHPFGDREQRPRRRLRR